MGRCKNCVNIYPADKRHIPFFVNRNICAMNVILKHLCIFVINLAFTLICRKCAIVAIYALFCVKFSTFISWLWRRKYNIYILQIQYLNISTKKNRLEESIEANRNQHVPNIIIISLYHYEDAKEICNTYFIRFWSVQQVGRVFGWESKWFEVFVGTFEYWTAPGHFQLT